MYVVCVCMACVSVRMYVMYACDQFVCTYDLCMCVVLCVYVRALCVYVCMLRMSVCNVSLYCRRVYILLFMCVVYVQFVCILFRYECMSVLYVSMIVSLLVCLCYV